MKNRLTLTDKNAKLSAELNTALHRNAKNKQRFSRAACSTLCITLLLGIQTAAIAQTEFTNGVAAQEDLCTGADCETATLPRDTLRISNPSPTLLLESPNRNDWRFLINDDDAFNGESFALQSLQDGNLPFLIEAGAPSNAFVIGADSSVEPRIGVGTANPEAQLHILDGDTPTIRLESTEQIEGSSEAPAKFDIAANEIGFFISDTPNGVFSAPFGIRRGTPDNSLRIQNEGFVGIMEAGSDHNDITAPLTVQRLTNRNPIALFSNAGPARLELRNATKSVEGNETDTWVINSNGTLRFTAGGVPGRQFDIDTQGNVTILGELTTAGSACSSGCDAIFKQPVPSISDNAASMWAEGYLPAMGPTVENAPFNVSKKTQSMLHELEKAHIYIDQIDDLLITLENSLSAANL